MTRTNKRKRMLLSIIVLAFAALAATVIFTTNKPTTAHAAMQSQFVHVAADGGGGGGGGSSSTSSTASAIVFDWEQTNTNGTGGGVTTSKSNGTGTSKTISTGTSSSTTVIITITGMGESGYVSTSSPTVAVSCSGISTSLKIYNSSGSQIASGSKSVSLSGLSEGTYSGEFRGSAAWTVNSRAGASVGLVCTFRFTVDFTSPIMSGASTSSTGMYTNNAFTVYASDGGSGVGEIFYLSPTASSYMSTTSSSYTVSTGSANGLWRFYAKDKAGNTSGTYYAYYDNTAPAGTIKNAAGATVTSAYISGGFSFTASDTHSGIQSLEYKAPNSSSWTSYAAGRIINNGATGTHLFRATDKAGNTVTKSIILDNQLPTGTLYADTNAVSSGSRVRATYIRFVPSDALSGVSSCTVKNINTGSSSTYVSGSQISVDGTYQFTVKDNCGNEATGFTITLDNTAPTMNSSLGMFYETTGNGFSVSASDNGGCTLYKKAPGEVAYSAVSGNSISLDAYNPNGKYYFYAVDSVGNETEKKWIELAVQTPVISLKSVGRGNSVALTWDTVTPATGDLNSATYSKGEQVSAEGTYVLNVSNYGREARMVFSIDHYYVPGEVVPPTCTTDGYTVYTCDNCGDVQHNDIVPMFGHDFTAWKTEVGATCIEDGYESHKCNRCSLVETRTLPKRGHDYKTVVIAPTCLEKGQTDHTCRRCGNYYFDAVTDALGHNYIVTWVPPTCTEHGYNLHKCSRCEDNYETDSVPATGHSYAEEAIQATCTEAGYMRHFCVRCNFEYHTDEIAAFGHDLHTEVTVAPTCETAGERWYKCERCEYENLQKIPATGHNYQLLESYEQDGLNIRIYECSICGKRYEENLGSQYEEVTDYIIYLFDLYRPYMWWVLLGTVGIWSIVLGVMIAIANKNDEKDKAKRMLINYLIGIVVIAVIFVAAPYLVRGIAIAVTG